MCKELPHADVQVVHEILDRCGEAMLQCAGPPPAFQHREQDLHPARLSGWDINTCERVQRSQGQPWRVES